MGGISIILFHPHGDSSFHQSLLFPELLSHQFPFHQSKSQVPFHHEHQIIQSQIQVTNHQLKIVNHQ
ncbi:MAG: hypothetical protein WCG25_09045, partial [bacterium]